MATTRITNKKHLEEKAMEYLEIQRQIEELEKKKDAIKEQIQKYLGDKEEVITENYKVRWTRFTSTRFDTSLLKEVNRAMYERYLTTSESRRFSVTPEKGGN